MRTLINAARTGFIAHNLMNDAGRVLQTNDLFNALEDIRSIFNELCIPGLDSRVEPITNSEIFSMQFYEKVGFDLPIMRVFNNVDDSESE